jgi:uncharacterized protein YkwD
MHSIARWLRRIFIPHEDNGSEPHVFRDASVEILLFIVILGFALAVAERTIVRESNMLAAVYSSALVDLANGERRTATLGELKVNPLLEKAAALKAEDMATKSYFAHYSPEGVSPWYWMRQAGYNYLYAGENLAIDFSDSIDVSRAWMNSPTHRANVLNGHYTEIGIAVRQGTYQGRPTTFVVEMFGSPKSSPKVGAVPHELSLLASVGPFMGFAASNPRYMMVSLYGAVVLIVIFGLIGLATVEWHKRHKRHVLLCILLLIVIMSLSLTYFAGSTLPQIASMSPLS